MVIGERMRECRMMRGMSQAELAYKAGTEPNSISRWETEKIKPNAASLRNIASALSVPIGYLMGDLPKGSIKQNVEKIINNDDEATGKTSKIVIERGEGENKMRVEYSYIGNFDDEMLLNLKKIFDWASVEGETEIHE